MTSRPEILEHHTLVVRDGRILDVLPTTLATGLYAAAVRVDRGEHLLLPGLVNACTQLKPDTGRAAPAGGPQRSALAAIAQMLSAGTTCFCDLGHAPGESARTAAEQGMRAVIGIPIGAEPGPWAASPEEYLTRALAFRDEYRGHPSIATAFAPHSAEDLEDATLRRIGTLADELDAGILMHLHESQRAVQACVERRGMRPIERLRALGLLTPALTALNMVHAGEADIALAQRAGIAIASCPQANFRSGDGAAPVGAWKAAALRVGLGSGTGAAATGFDLWQELRLLALLSLAVGTAPDEAATALAVYDALAAATRGGAAALGLDAEIGTLEHGKWADLCCVNMGGPATRGSADDRTSALCSRLVWNGGRDVVSDVWVSGRHLLNDGAFTRLDWPAVAVRAHDS